MLICKKCETKFSSRIVIDGEIKNLGNRKYCLECSPWGKHNTKQIHLSEKEKKQGQQTVCERCGREYIYEKEKGHSLNKCNSCVVNVRRLDLKKEAVKYLGGTCSICCYSKSVRAMDFHHINPIEKVFNISYGYMKSWEEIKRELDKCILLCCRCHREIEDGYYSDDEICELYSSQKRKIDVTEKLHCKKRKNEYFCKRCGSKKKHKSKSGLCEKCSTKRKVVWPKKEDLLNDVGKFSWTKIGDKYNVSGKTVKKWAIAYGLI